MTNLQKWLLKLSYFNSDLNFSPSCKQNYVKKICKILLEHVVLAPEIYLKTRQVYNLFQDLWNKFFGLIQRFKRGAKNSKNIKRRKLGRIVEKTSLRSVLKGDLPTRSSFVF